MATMGNWNGHTFVVSPSLIRGYTDLSIEGGCETTTKNSDKQKYEERKYGESPTVSFTIGLNAQLGVTDVYGEAMEFVKEATEGACAYFYLGATKLIPAKLILTKATVTEIVNMPGRGDQWISCDVSLTLKQGAKTDGSNGVSSGSGAGGSAKASVKTSGAKTSVKEISPTEMLNNVKNFISNAKTASSEKTTGGLQYLDTMASKAAQSTKTTATKVNATTNRKCDITKDKITLVGKSPAIAVSVR